MARLNAHYLKLAAGYLFPEIGRRVAAYAEANPAASLIRLGIGDVVLPLPESVREAMHRAIDELGTEEGFHGYGPEQGYGFLREAIAEGDFAARGIVRIQFQLILDRASGKVMLDCVHGARVSS